ncbi:hypothetical protein N7510_005766 [Penicillium lagena]|uniref:uncharacterized protein n=1 Tax=Penicillium lagena TaxID=94218 RepID=UPI00253F68F9|nr:uncharacterized protein N7510_005766 [Penicillium lagena]KAJ5612572.1 hypothetical protein N7510_005766 [Penicillium lagena]
MDVKLPSRAATVPARSGTVTSTLTRRTSMSDADDEAIPHTDSSESTNLLLERLRAWKHMTAYLEDYVSTTAKVSRANSKDYEKVLKTVSDPLKEGHHFSSSAGGVAGLFENMRNNSQGIVNMYLETEKNLKSGVLPTLERLHKEIKNKSKELKSGAVKGAKAVEKARQATQKHIELLGQNSAAFDAAAAGKIEQQHDPYLLRRMINHRLNKQVNEENTHRQDVLALQNSFQQFEAHILQTVQGALEQFFQQMNNQLDRQRAMYADILGTAQLIPPDFEWINFIVSNDSKLVNPDSPPRQFGNISFPNQDHRSTQPLIEGSLERRSRAVIKGFSTGYYVVTPAKYLHEFKDTDDFRRDPTPELSLYLPDCVIGSIDGVKFNVKGKDVSNGKVGNAFTANTELTFKAHTPSDAEKWWSVIKESTRSQSQSQSQSQPLPSSGASPASSRSTSASHQPEKASDAAETGVITTNITDTKDQVASPTALSRSASTASHFHTSPGGSAVQEKSEKS